LRRFRTLEMKGIRVLGNGSREQSQRREREEGMCEEICAGEKAGVERLWARSRPRPTRMLGAPHPPAGRRAHLNRPGIVGGPPGRAAAAAAPALSSAPSTSGRPLLYPALPPSPETTQQPVPVRPSSHPHPVPSRVPVPVSPRIPVNPVHGPDAHHSPYSGAHHTIPTPGLRAPRNKERR
jgi:hypothetical protein